MLLRFPHHSMSSRGHDHVLIWRVPKIFKEFENVGRCIVIPGFKIQSWYARVIAIVHEVVPLPKRICRRYRDYFLELGLRDANTFQNVSAWKLGPRQQRTFL